MSYAELGWFGFLRKVARCGPVTMFNRLVYEWDDVEPSKVAEKVRCLVLVPSSGDPLVCSHALGVACTNALQVKKFFFYYGINRHKATTLTPSYHAEGYSPDDNRFDLRPFLYPSQWKRQFAKVDEMAAKFETERKVCSRCLAQGSCVWHLVDLTLWCGSCSTLRETRSFTNEFAATRTCSGGVGEHSSITKHCCWEFTV